MILSPLLALSGHRLVHCTCPLLGVKRTSTCALQMSAFDPKRTYLWLRLTLSRLVVCIAMLSCLVLGGAMRRRDFIILLGGVAVRPTIPR
jgi:hypothetical protein